MYSHYGMNHVISLDLLLFSSLLCTVYFGEAKHLE